MVKLYYKKFYCKLENDTADQIERLAATMNHPKADIYLVKREMRLLEEMLCDLEHVQILLGLKSRVQENQKLITNISMIYLFLYVIRKEGKTFL